ncbi:MAG TPA: hypothetical protein VF844_10070 [Ktedonobacteraceae bacterium]
MMNRDRMTRGRAYSSGATTFGLPERLERTLIYPLSLLLGFVPAVGWLLAWLLGIGVFFFEKNRNVRWHALQAATVFGSLSVLLAVVWLLKSLLGGILLIGGVISIGLGLLSSVIFWVMIILAVFLTIMAWLRPDYRLPFVSTIIDRWV